jgi:hypothetical protein
MRAENFGVQLSVEVNPERQHTLECWLLHPSAVSRQAPAPPTCQHHDQGTSAVLYLWKQLVKNLASTALQTQ